MSEQSDKCPHRRRRYLVVAPDTRVIDRVGLDFPAIGIIITNARIEGA